jgi:hypothetical protein
VANLVTTSGLLAWGRPGANEFSGPPIAPPAATKSNLSIFIAGKPAPYGYYILDYLGKAMQYLLKLNSGFVVAETASSKHLAATQDSRGILGFIPSGNWGLN